MLNPEQKLVCTLFVSPMFYFLVAAVIWNELKPTMKASCIALLAHSSAVWSLKLQFFFNFSNSLKNLSSDTWLLSSRSQQMSCKYLVRCFYEKGIQFFYVNFEVCISFDMFEYSGTYTTQKGRYLFSILLWKSSI